QRASKPWGWHGLPNRCCKSKASPLHVQIRHTRGGAKRRGGGVNAPPRNAPCWGALGPPERPMTPLILGINRTQDASICVMRGSEVLCSIQKERLTRQKHHWGKLEDFRMVYGPRIECLREPVDVLVECFSSDREIERLPQYQAELAETIRFAPGCRRTRISHHLAHVYSVFHPSPFDEAAVMVIDGQGSPAHEFTERWDAAASLPGHWREVSSFYAADRNGVECLGKQLWDCNEGVLVGLGMFYHLLTQAIFGGEGNEGK